MFKVKMDVLPMFGFNATRFDLFSFSDLRLPGGRLIMIVVCNVVLFFHPGGAK